jgi:hypothetical protein
VDAVGYIGKPSTASYADAASSQVPSGASKVRHPPAAPSAADLKVKKVKQAISKAERSITIFNLDLGPVPVLNQETLSRKVTIKLHELAKTEGMYKKDPAAAEEAMDDLLSCATLDFLGKGSTKFNNRFDRDDKRNGKMCTVPVKLTWRDKDSRSLAEQTLRKACKVRCGIPYPKKLRNLIKTTVSEGQAIHPDCFIKVKVDTENLQVTASARSKDGWTDLDIAKNIPIDLLENQELAAATADEEVEMSCIS